MESPQVLAFCAVIAISSIVVHAAPYPGLLSGIFGDGLTQGKQTPVDINQLLRQYYLSPTDDPYSQYNPYAGQVNYPQPNYVPYSAPGYNMPNVASPQGYYSNPNPYSSSLMNMYRSGSLGGLSAPGAASGPSAAAGSSAVASAGGGSMPAVRSAANDDSLAASHYSKQLDSLLPNAAKGLQSYANFRILPSSEADEAHQQAAELLPSQAALQAPAERSLPGGGRATKHSGEASSNSER